MKKRGRKPLRNLDAFSKVAIWLLVDAWSIGSTSCSPSRGVKTGQQASGEEAKKRKRKKGAKRTLD